MKLLSRFIFWITGWKIVGENPKALKKFVMIAAPHTSNWDLLYARAAYYLMSIRVKYTIKKELFFFPLGWFLKSLGGIPIDRNKKKGNMVQQMARNFKKWEELALLVTPEGTRSYAKEWKKGFYYIALEAKVPIVLGYLDYAKKIAGIGPVIHPSGDIEADLEKILTFYRGITPKYPEKGVI
ncbi:MAG: lysophospholipid acyltransferase family protein [Vicingaceae bacterium]